MGENQLLVDTDVLIAYLDRRAYRSYLESPRYRVYYSAITKKEPLSKRGLKTSQRQAIFALLRRFRLVPIDLDLNPKERKQYGKKITGRS